MNNEQIEQQLLIELQYLGTVGYFSKLFQAPNAIIEQHENYRKRSYRNRCHLMSANGILKLSIPLKKGKHEQLSIRKVEIDNSQNWQQLHWRGIQSAYGKSPFYEYYADELKVVFEEKHEYLFDFTWKLQVLIIELMQLDIDLSCSDTFSKTPPENVIDARNSILPNKKVDSIIFKKYNQVFEERYGFIENLSILDLLFCVGPEAELYL